MKPDRVPVLLSIPPGIFRLAISTLLEQASFDVLDWHGNVDALASARVPALAILDAAVGTDKVVDLARELQNNFAGIPLILLADSEDGREEVLRAGVSGYVLKTQPGAELIDAAHTVLRGGIYVKP